MQDDYILLPQDKEPGSPDEAFAYLINKGKLALPADYFPEWKDTCDRLYQAGYGSVITLSYLRHSPKLANYIQCNAITKLSITISRAAIKTNITAAENLSIAAVIAARQYKSTSSFVSWLTTIDNIIDNAPESLQYVVEIMGKIVSSLDRVRFNSWVIAGLRISAKDVSRQISFFSLNDSESEKWFQYEAGDIVFSKIERSLKLYLLTLWGLNTSMVNSPTTSSQLRLNRISINNGVIRVPEVFSGVSKSQYEKLYLASIAHAGAHLTFSHSKFHVGDLKPIQIVLISLLEDARVEYLAIQNYPGLKELWLPFHTAKSSGPKIIPSLLARLSKTLIDENYHDEDGWVNKGRRLFYQSLNDINNPVVFRKIGVLLGNDLGQLRAQFNDKSYIVEPGYRDDNHWLWESPYDDNNQDNDSVEVEAVTLNNNEARDPPESVDSQLPQEEVEQTDAAKRCSNEGLLSIDISKRYPEYDYIARYERPDWGCVVECIPKYGDYSKIDNIVETHSSLINQIKKIIESVKVGVPKKLYKQSIGDTLDLAACIDAAISKRVGLFPDTNVYNSIIRKNRDLSVLVLLDCSYSTREKINNTNLSVLDLEIQATSILANVLSQLGDPFAIASFCSDGKENVHYYRIKNFDGLYDNTSKAFLSGLSSNYSTRIGMAMRHAVNDLSSQKTHRKLLLVITDGEPSDIDEDDSRYLVEDAKKAIQNNAKFGINSFCVGLDKNGEDYLNKIFGQKNYKITKNISSLPAQLTQIYLRLTT